MGGFPKGVHLQGLRGTAVIPAEQCKGHLQGKSGAAGHPQLLEAVVSIHAAGNQGEAQEGIYGKAAVEKFAQAVQKLMAAKQSGYKHRQHLRKNHKSQPVVRNHAHREHDGRPGAEGHYQQIQYNGDLQAEYALIGKLVIPFFRTGNELSLQLPQIAAEGNGLLGGSSRLRFRSFLGCGCKRLLNAYGLLCAGCRRCLFRV